MLTQRFSQRLPVMLTISLIAGCGATTQSNTLPPGPAPQPAPLLSPQNDASLQPALAAPTPTPAPTSPEGLITLHSPRLGKETMDRLEAKVKSSGFTVVARVDHAAAATRVNKSLRYTELLIFGNPAGGTLLMECSQTAGIDLPMKALVWSDASGKVMISYNAPSYIAKRHLSPDCPAAANIGETLDGMMKAVVAP